MQPVVAFIGTGGTISSIGKDGLDIMDYAAQGVMLHADQILARFPEVAEVATVIPVPYRNVPSFDIFYPQWRELVLLNGEIHAAREVTKTATYRMQTFRSPDFGVLGHADGDAVVFYRRPERRAAPATEFDISSLETLPRVDIAYAYTGSDGTAVRAFVAAGARGIVSAGFAPGFSGTADAEALREAVARGGCSPPAPAAAARFAAGGCRTGGS